ncbi:hypothetical protein [Bradyrhizobium japonicum]|nr:hypothetical protein [Bradyrhizobium japonicum]
MTEHGQADVQQPNKVTALPLAEFSLAPFAEASTTACSTSRS